MTQPINQPEATKYDIGLIARTYSPALKKFFQRRILEHADVDDLVQEVFLRLTRRGDLQDVTNLEGYVFQTAANILRDRIRQSFTRPANYQQSIDEKQVEDAAFSPERVLLGKEALGRIQTALFELPERTRAVFLMCRIEGFTNADVAGRLGISLSAVNKHLAKAMNHLLTCMQDDLS